MSRISVALLLLLGLSSGCDCQGPEGADAGLGLIELGTGSLEFESLEQDQALILVSGTQGGYHFVVNARIRELLPGNPSVPNELGNPITSFLLFREDETRIDALFPAYRLGYRPATDGWFELPSGRILQVNQDLIDEEGLVPAIYQERVRIRVEVRDVRGEMAAAEVWVAPQPDMRPDAGLFQDAGLDANP